MMGNVSGVSQFLETVGVPVGQVGPESAPGQDFAAVMQQTAQENGTAFNGLQSGPSDEESSATASGAANGSVASSKTTAAQAQGTVAQTVSEKDALRQAAHRVAVAALSQTGGRRAGSVSEIATAGDVDAAEAGNAVQTALVAAGKTVTPIKAATVSESATPAVTKEVPQASDARAPLAANMAALKSSVSDGPKTETAGSKENSIGETKQTEKPSGAKVDSKLTSLIPQGTAEVPQSSQGTTLNAVPMVPLVALPITQDAAKGPSTEGQAAAEATPVNAASMLAATETGAAWKAQNQEMSSVATIAPVSGTIANAVPMAASEPASTSVAAASTVQVNSSVGGSITTSVAAVGPVILPESALVKPAVSSGRNAVSAAKVNSGIVTSVSTNAATDAAATVAPAAPVQGAVPKAVVQGAQTVVGHVASSGGDHKAAGKPVEPAGTPVAVAASPAKSEAADSLAGAAASPKDASHNETPVAAAQLAAASVSAAVTNTATAAVMPALAPHAAAVTDTVRSVANGAAEISGVQTQSTTGLNESLPHTMLSSTPTSLEVGVSSGTHGWLKIRAELNAAGEVNASLTGATPAATEKLRGELPALSSYLQGEKVAMGTLNVQSALHIATASFESGSSFSQAGGNANGASVAADAGAAGGRAQQQAQQDANTVPVLDNLLNNGRDGDTVVLGRMTDTAAYGIQRELGGGEGSSSAGYGAGGSWLNVRA